MLIIFRSWRLCAFARVISIFVNRHRFASGNARSRNLAGTESQNAIVRFLRVFSESPYSITHSAVPATISLPAESRFRHGSPKTPALGAFLKPKRIKVISRRNSNPGSPIITSFSQSAIRLVRYAGAALYPQMIVETTSGEPCNSY